MTPEQLENLIASGESMTLEFKGEERGMLNDREIYEIIVCLANAEGGHILIGVEDDGRITGAKPRHGNSTDTTKLQAAIFNNTEPRINSRVSLVTTPQGEVICLPIRFVANHAFG